MPNRWHLGNDIVDLSDPRHTGKARDDRFLQRVFSHKEREDIHAAESQDRALWNRWAGKEAAFKTISKSLGVPPTFIHPDFQVTIFGPAGPRGPAAEAGAVPDSPVTRFGQVRYGDFRLPLRIESVGTALHAVTWIPDPGHDMPPFIWGSQKAPGPKAGWKEELEPRFSQQEWGCVSHRHSALARLAARRAIASSMSVEEDVLEIRCGPGKPGRRIPQVFLRGEEVSVDLTLSHHGQLLAWAYLVPPQLKGR
jgi:hypothetical protein